MMESTQRKGRFFSKVYLVTFCISIFLSLVGLCFLPSMSVLLLITANGLWFGGFFALLTIIIVAAQRPKGTLKLILLSAGIIIFNLVILTSIWVDRIHLYNYKINVYKDISELAPVLAKSENNKQSALPPADKWCDVIMGGENKKLEYAFSSMYGCTKAFNENISGFEYSQLPGNVILLFEAEGPWNLHGSEDLFFKHSKWYDTGFILFADGTIGEYKYSNGKLKLYEKGNPNDFFPSKNWKYAKVGANDYLPLKWEP